MKLIKKNSELPKMNQLYFNNKMFKFLCRKKYVGLLINAGKWIRNVKIKNT